MPKKRRKTPLTETPKGRIVSAIRRLWMQSPERAAALKRTGYRCAGCGAKQSAAKDHELSLEVHHNMPIGPDHWDEMVDLIRKYVLVRPDFLTPLCPDCHDAVHISIGSPKKRRKKSL